MKLRKIPMALFAGISLVFAAGAADVDLDWIFDAYAREGSGKYAPAAPVEASKSSTATFVASPSGEMRNQK